MPSAVEESAVVGKARAHAWHVGDGPASCNDFLIKCLCQNWMRDTMETLTQHQTASRGTGGGNSELDAENSQSSIHKRRSQSVRRRLWQDTEGICSLRS